MPSDIKCFMEELLKVHSLFIFELLSLYFTFIRVKYPISGISNWKSEIAFLKER